MADLGDAADIDAQSKPPFDLSSDEHVTPSDSNGDLSNGAPSEVEEQDAEDGAGKAGVDGNGENGDAGDNGDNPQPVENVFQLTVQLPHEPGQTQIMVSTQEQVQDIRQSIVDTPHTFQYSCFHLEHKGKRINDFIELSEVADIVQEPTCKLVEDPYTEAQARVHVVRVRELIGAAGDRTDVVMGIDAGISLCDSVDLPTSNETNPVADYNINAPATISTLLAKPLDPAPKTVKTISLSSWNPPPHHLRMRGHLLYLVVTTNEGEQYYITSAVSGFYVNKSTNNKFDPSPRSSPKAFAAHSLITLLEKISPSFDASFRKLQEYNGQRDPLAAYQLSNSIPAAPWLVSSSSTQHHQADLTRTQEAFLLGGADNAETLRDWNEEFQSTRELPKETVQDRVFRERLTSKLFAEYNEAAVRGAVLVARGEVQPLNPTEARDAQIFVYNNVFYSFGADGVGTFATDGGDEAARVATGKDVQGVKAVNQLDVNGLFTPGTVVVDYLGKRIVGQSIVPGIFKQRDPGEHQIDYGGVEGKDTIATLDSFIQPFSDLSKAMRVKRHTVWDKEGKKHELEASVETKGLLGTDGRKYVLDLYRVTPLDIHWLEQHCGEGQEDGKKYPHRMTVLRPELVDSYRIARLREYISKELEKKRASKAAEEEGAAKVTNGEAGEEKQLTNGDGKANGEQSNGETAVAKTEEAAKEQRPQETVDVSGFSFTLNPDVFSGQQPQTDEEKAEMDADELAVRAVCTYLTSDVIPRLVREMQEGEVGFPMDGQNLVREMHKRGINVRYLGEVYRICQERESDKRAQALGRLAMHEMVSRAFKHFANAQLKELPPCFAQHCVSHLLNCLLGSGLNAQPRAEMDDELKAMYPDIDFGFAKVTPESLSAELKRQIEVRYRVKVDSAVVQEGKELQLLREVCLKMGFQLEAKEYQFSKEQPAQQTNGLAEKQSSDSLAVPQTNGVHPPAEGGKKKKKNKQDHSPNRAGSASPTAPPTTFSAENILNIVPIFKDAAPRSVLAEEALDAGRMSLSQDQKELGQELLLESLSLHEQIYGILHPEVARVYYALSTIYYSLNEKSAAIELARKAVIVSERTLGVDNPETILSYLNLSLFEHADGNTKHALAYVRHALNLWKLIYGARHPDSITTLNNAAVMLQSLKLFHESRIWFEVSLDICEEVSGRHAIATATLLFQLAQALALDQDSKAAVAKMRESYSIFKSELGADNPNTKEAESWLETLTHSAVNQAKQANALQNRRILLGGNRGGRVQRLAVGGKPQPMVGGQLEQGEGLAAAAATATTTPGRQPGGTVDQRSLDELLKYINGEGAGKSGSTKKATRNPKRRQAAAA